MVSRYLTLLCVVCVLSVAGSGQSGVCKANEFPVGIINAKGEAFRGLTPASFTAQVGGNRESLTSMSFDEGPRRVVLIVDASRKLSDDTRKAERLLVETLLNSARKEDSYALIVARGAEQTVKFGEDRKSIVDAVPLEPSGKSTKGGVLDAVMQGITLLGPAQPGDSILVIAADLEGNKTTSARKVTRALHDHRIRMLGLALGPVSAQNYMAGGQTTTSLGLATTTPGVGELTYDTGDQDYYPLTHDSGGIVISAMNGSPQRSYNMKDPKLQQELAYKAQVISNVISTYYRAEVGPVPARVEDLIVLPSDNLRKQFPQMFLLYPHQVGPCS
ncbi:MAG TPA: hypothetical protein VE783_02475 [Candidatus Limnocylindrales bacterium]|jgi:hypothetical protein|nr:hypothetical protein [Candidatus Limnocylindrales bacterium]